jgi:hypothetical protein
MIDNDGKNKGKDIGNSLGFHLSKPLMSQVEGNRSWQRREGLATERGSARVGDRQRRGARLRESRRVREGGLFNARSDVRSASDQTCDRSKKSRQDKRRRCQPLSRRLEGKKGGEDLPGEESSLGFFRAAMSNRQWVSGFGGIRPSYWPPRRLRMRRSVYRPPTRTWVASSRVGPQLWAALRSPSRGHRPIHGRVSLGIPGYPPGIWVENDIRNHWRVSVGTSG